MEDQLIHHYTWRVDALAIVLRYLAFAGVAYFIFYVLRCSALKPFKIQKAEPTGHQVRVEMAYSLFTLVIYCTTSWLVFKAYEGGNTMIYTSISQHGMTYFIFSIALMIIMHDAYFYWTHRLMHIPVLYRWFHRTHHRSRNPTPWAAFSFHPLEALISIGIYPIIILLIPCHPFALFGFTTFMMLINVMGHLGYELFPPWFTSDRIGRWQNTSTNHNLHHRLSKANYGLYFTFWDRLMNTYAEEPHG